MYTNKRRKQAGMVLAAIMAAATLMTGCAEESSQDDTIVITSEETAVTSGTEEAAETLSGRVVSVTESVLTIESGGAPEGMEGGNHRNSSDRKHRIHGCRWKQHYLCGFGGRQPGSSYLG